MTVHDRLPPEFECTAELVEQQAPEAKRVFQCALAVAMEERAHRLGVSLQLGRCAASIRGLMHVALKKTS